MLRNLNFPKNCTLMKTFPSVGNGKRKEGMGTILFQKIVQFAEKPVGECLRFPAISALRFTIWIVWTPHFVKYQL